MSVADALPPEMLVPRNCTLTPYQKLANLPSFTLRDELIAYASPDSTYAVTKRLMQAARLSILIGIYDFTATYMRDLLLDAMKRGVKVSLMLDIDSPEEQAIFDQLAAKGCTAVPAPSCASKKVHYFRSSHEKVIVIDDIWTLVQSGNYSQHSIPPNETDGGDGAFITGNRDMGVAVKSAVVAKFFTDLLQRDMELELSATRLGGEQPAPLVSATVQVPAPTKLPARRFRSLSLRPQAPVSAVPVLTPENYTARIVPILKGATHSIWIENQYIKVGEPGITKLLDAIAAARAAKRGLDVRIVLAFGMDGGAAVRQTFADLKKRYRLTPGTQLRLLDPSRFTHCHNKLIIVDGERVLVSSQNWSDAAVLENREAGLLLNSEALAKYYGDIFTSDWDSGLRSVPTPRKRPAAAAPVALIPANRGDYVEV